jgi:ribonuclease-3
VKNLKRRDLSYTTTVHTYTASILAKASRGKLKDTMAHTHQDDRFISKERQKMHVDVENYKSLAYAIAMQAAKDYHRASPARRRVIIKELHSDYMNFITNGISSILADAFEAVLAAVYLDGGLEEASKIVLRFVPGQDTIEETKDYKTTLQEIIQRNREEHVEYVLTDSSGPDHAKVFTVEVHLNSNVIGKGIGKSKKLAEQQAAKEALALMGIR